MSVSTATDVATPLSRRTPLGDCGGRREALESVDPVAVREVMMVRTACGTALLVAGLLMATPAVADEEPAEADEAPAATQQTDDDPVADDPAEDPDAVDDEQLARPATGLAFAPAFHDPDTDVRVLGNDGEDQPWTLDIGGYIRSGFTHIQADPDHELFGRNDGFMLWDARLTNRGQLDNGLGFVMTLDAGSRLIRTSPNSPVEELAVRMTDTYVYWAPLESELLELNLGQFKAPFDAEDLISTAEMLFIDRSVANRGVQDVEGFNVEGLTQDRQLGGQARGKIPFADVEGPDGEDQALGVSYAAAVANGNGPNRSMNENQRLATYGRLVAHWGDVVAVGAAAHRNPRTFGDPPDQVDRIRRGWTADLQANAMGFSLFTNIVNERRAHPDIDEDPTVTARGYQVQLAWEDPLFGIQPAYRFAHYDPTSDPGDEAEDGFFEDDALTYHTIGLNYNSPDYPLRLMANYTIKSEQENRRLDNDQLDLLLQLQW